MQLLYRALGEMPAFMALDRDVECNNNFRIGILGSATSKRLYEVGLMCLMIILDSQALDKRPCLIKQAVRIGSSIKLLHEALDEV